MMTLNEMKLAVCEKLPELMCVEDKVCYWKAHTKYNPTHNGVNFAQVIHWPTEGLQVCHEAEKLLTQAQRTVYNGWLTDYTAAKAGIEAWTHHATYEQRLEALCRVWFPERF